MITVVYMFGAMQFICKKVLMNLFTNSMKYNKVNGSIYMSMRTIERSEDHMTCEFKIRDNGIGMSVRIYKK